MSLSFSEVEKIMLKKQNYNYSSYLITSLLLLFITSLNTAGAQEYATDRLFMKEFSKTKCRTAAEAKISGLKINRVMTKEQEALLNQNVWSKLRVNLPLSPGEKRHLRKIKQQGVSKNKLSRKKLWARKAATFKRLRQKCK